MMMSNTNCGECLGQEGDHMMLRPGTSDKLRRMPQGPMFSAKSGTCVCQTQRPRISTCFLLQFISLLLLLNLSDVPGLTQLGLGDPRENGVRGWGQISGWGQLIMQSAGPLVALCAGTMLSTQLLLLAPQKWQVGFTFLHLAAIITCGCAVISSPLY